MEYLFNNKNMGMDMSEICEKCGFENPMDSEFLSKIDCPRCGVVYKKEQKITTRGVPEERKHLPPKSSDSKKLTLWFDCSERPLLSIVFSRLAFLYFLLAVVAIFTIDMVGYVKFYIFSILIGGGLTLLAVAQILEYLFNRTA